MPSIFISYSHADKPLALSLADALKRHGLEVWIDEGELKVGDSLIERIATAIAEIDFFLALVSESSRDSNWCRKELALAVTGELGREGVTVLPVRVDGTDMPAALADVFYLDLDKSNIDEMAEKIAAAIPKHQEEERQRQAARQASRALPARSPATTSRLAGRDEFEPIRIVGIVEEGVGRPRGDGSRGSALYRIPLRLSRRPTPEWARQFVETWDHPPQFTTMHRPGIASVSGDTVILNGTTMDELEQFHVDTLRHVVEKVNADIAAHDRQHRLQVAREDEAKRQHDESVREISARLKFH